MKRSLAASLLFAALAMLAPQAAQARPLDCWDVCDCEASCDTTCWDGRVTRCGPAGHACIDRCVSAVQNPVAVKDAPAFTHVCSEANSARAGS